MDRHEARLLHSRRAEASARLGGNPGSRGRSGWRSCPAALRASLRGLRTQQKEPILQVLRQWLPPDPLVLDVDRADQWPRGAQEAVFSGNTTPIMDAASMPRLLLYGPFFGGGVPTAPGNAAFDAHLCSLDPAMGLLDAHEVSEQALSLDLEALADEAMPANKPHAGLSEGEGPPSAIHLPRPLPGGFVNEGLTLKIRSGPKI